MYSMTLRAARRNSDLTTCRVNRLQDTAADIVVKRPRASYYGRQRKGSYKGSRNLVWTLEQSPLSSESQPRKNVAYVSEKSPVSGTGKHGPYHPRKNAANGSKNSSVLTIQGCGLGDSISPKSRETVCKYWMSGNCKYGEQCRCLHSWCFCPGLEMLASLEGHKKDIKGISLPLGSDGLYTASDDGTLRVWDYNTGHCMHVINLGAEAGSLINEGPWVFVGMPNAVKAHNVQTAKDFFLEGPVGQVHAMAVADDMLFAGTSSGVISVWKGNTDNDPFEYATSLKGHDGAVVCFIVGGQNLYSGSVDQTIKVWDLNTLQCTMTLRQHTDIVTSLLCWDQYLLSGSLDGTIKVWATAKSGNLEVIFTHQLEHGVRALSGMTDSEAKPMIFCSCENKIVYIYDLPSIKERGRMFSRHTIGALTIGFGGQLYTGDINGKLRVWSFRSQNGS